MVKAGRNDPCPCGSGKKYKKCCGQEIDAQAKPALSAKGDARASQQPLQAATVPPQDMNQLGILFNAGRHAELESGARTLLKQYPTSGVIWQILGIALKMQGKDAVSALQKAIELMPHDAGAHNNLGTALQDMGRLQEAAASYRQALKIKPDFIEVWNNLGNTLKDLGQFEDAIASYRQALAFKPDFAEGYNSLGNVQLRLHRTDDAMGSYRRALQINPEFAEAHNSMGGALLRLDLPSDAAECYRRALKINPGYSDAHYNLGNTLKDLSKIEEAVISYSRALAIKPDLVEAYNNQALALQGVNRVDQAIESYRLALEIKPDYADAHNGLGSALARLERFDVAMTSYLRALAIIPDYAEAHYNLGNALRDLGRLDDAVASYQRALKIKPDFVPMRNNLLFALQFVEGISNQDLFAAHRSFGEQFETALKPQWPVHANNRDPSKRLKIGYVSGDFRKHAVAFFFEPVLTNKDESQVEVYCYSNSAKRDAVTDRLMERADHWRSCVDLTDEELSQTIRADGIDILVDLAGHTAQNRLMTFARKPAPIQVTYLGYPGSSGLSAMDYRLTDRYTEPGNDQYYTERLLRLPDSMWCYRPTEGMPEVTSLPALTNGFLTFGSFNNFNKIGNACIALWAKLLCNLPTARLLMVTVPEGEMRTRLVRKFSEQGVSSDRIDFCGSLPQEEFQLKLQQVDITLDPFPVNGATTTCESLWLGVPVLTLIGERFLSRAGLSVLSAAGLPEFAAATPEDFIALAKDLANDLPRLAAIRAGMRKKLSGAPLLDQRRFTRNLEAMYREMWRTYALA